MLAAIRPDDWNFPLLLHVLGAMLLVGGRTAAVVSFWLGWRRDTMTLSRLGFWSLLAVGFPSWWLMRLSAQWIYEKEGFSGDEDPGWIGIGFITAEGGGLLLLISIILAGIGVRRQRKRDGGPSTLVRVGAVLATVVLAAYLIAVWAMTAKPD
jgi:phage shock protein PspC (stress-responsive transcriptional regulator)